METKKIDTNKNTLSAVVIVKDEEEKIPDCLESLSWTDEIVVIDNGSQDKTAEISEKMGAKVYYYKGGTFSDLRNEGIKKATGKWLLYVDADERVTPLLRKEIEKVIESDGSENTRVAYAIPRRNIILGKEMKHGGWWPDYVKRLFLKDVLVKWSGKLHEEPHFTGEMYHLKNAFIHLKHDNLEDMIAKTNGWSEIEARLLLESGHPTMVWWRFVRIMLTELWYRLIVLRGFLDGIEGVIYAFYQMWSRFITYAKLWEMQMLSQDIKSKQ